jgi:cation-transporting ATPase 13A1
LIFSILTAAHVLYYGMQDEDRDKNKLFLRCIIIITTVVPPELPMVLSMTVNTSLMNLRKKKIFCTEPYKLPFAGNITLCAFDKTGTLTTDEL